MYLLHHLKRCNCYVILFSLKLQKQPPEVFYKKAVIKNFAVLTGKQLCWSLFLVKLQASRLATLLKRETPKHVFFCEIFKNAYFVKHWQTAASETHLLNSLTKLFIKILLCKNMISERF